MGVENTGPNELSGTGHFIELSKKLQKLSDRFPAPDQKTRMNKGSNQK